MIKDETKNFIISEFERKRNIKHQQRRLFEDSEIVKSLSLRLSIQKSKIIIILENKNFKMKSA